MQNENNLNENDESLNSSEARSAQNNAELNDRWERHLASLNLDDEDDYFIVSIGNIIDSGPKLSQGESVIKEFIKSIMRTNYESDGQGPYSIVKYGAPTGFRFPKYMLDEIEAEKIAENWQKGCKGPEA